MAGERIEVTGVVRDGAGSPVPDALVEVREALIAFVGDRPPGRTARATLRIGV